MAVPLTIIYRMK